MIHLVVTIDTQITHRFEKNVFFCDTKNFPHSNAITVLLKPVSDSRAGTENGREAAQATQIKKFASLTFITPDEFRRKLLEFERYEQTDQKQAKQWDKRNPDK